MDWKKPYSQNDYTTLRQCTESMQAPSRYPWHFLQKQNKINLKICMETQKTLNSQSNLEKEKWSWRNHAPWLLTIPQSHSPQNSMVLAQKQKDRSMEQARKTRNKPLNLWSINLWQKRLYSEGKIISSINGAGKTGQLHVKK